MRALDLVGALTTLIHKQCDPNELVALVHEIGELIEYNSRQFPAMLTPADYTLMLNTQAKLQALEQFVSCLIEDEVRK